jgi:heme/copper-type cytochrome/quinol oxidase subunit 4
MLKYVFSWVMYICIAMLVFWLLQCSYIGTYFHDWMYVHIAMLQFSYVICMFVSINEKQMPRSSLSPRTPGVNVVITILCDCCQFSAKNWCFFSTTNVIIKFFHELGVVWAKTPISLLFFRLKCFFFKSKHRSPIKFISKIYISCY